MARRRLWLPRLLQGMTRDGLLVELERLSKPWHAAVVAEVERAERSHEAMQQALLEVQTEVERLTAELMQASLDARTPSTRTRHQPASRWRRHVRADGRPDGFSNGAASSTVPRG